MFSETMEVLTERFIIEKMVGSFLNSDRLNENFKDSM